MSRFHCLAESKTSKSLKTAKSSKLTKTAKPFDAAKAVKAARADAPRAVTVMAKDRDGDHRVLLFQAQRAFMDDPADQIKVSSYRGVLARHLPSQG